MLRTIALSLLCASILAGPACGQNLPRVTLNVELEGLRVEAMPLSTSDSLVRLLGRDGRLWEIHPSEAGEARQTGQRFRPFTAAELRAALQRELGARLEVTGTGHYLVAHPQGKGGYWADRFEDLYRSFVHYFRARGLTVREPEFPLVAVVWGTREEFARHAAEQGYPPPPGLLGYYSVATNRISLFDIDSGKPSKEGWKQNAATIIHEATHQTAFNTGIHSRYTLPPRWLAEGLGMLFEAPGVYDSRHFDHQPERVNRQRLSQFRRYAQRRPAGTLLELIGSDRLFQARPDDAYAEAWALSFYLVETQPRKYCEYLKRTAALPAFAPYPSARRLADFTAIFGGNLRHLEAQYLEYVARLK
jgi:hypothetical protein